MRFILIGLVFSALLIKIAPVQASPVNNLASSTKVPAVRAATTEKVEQKAQTEPQAQAKPEQAMVATPEPVAIETSQPVASNDAKAFIYFNESGNDPTKFNSSGCFGLGQDCNGIVQPGCGTDYACQDQYFTDYMLRRYGSWEAAKSFWLARVPINGKDVGNWW